MEPVNEVKLGLFLKKEREKKGLTLEHLAKVTRLRSNYIEALENEEWDKLPGQVFIKGFLKTYTSALGLDYRQVIEEFKSSVPVHEGLPKPLVPPKKTNKVFIFSVITAVVIVSLIIFIYMMSSGPVQNKAETPAAKTSENKAIQGTVEDGSAKQAEKVNPIAFNNAQPPEKEAASSVETAVDSAKNVTPPPGPGAISQKAEAEKPVQAVIPEQAAKPVQEPVQQTSVAASVEEPAARETPRNTLTCFVSAKTYIKIWADNNPPVQHIFSDGSRHQWTAREGFYLLVGNAGGVEFDFNGKKIKDLGRQGEVVRLRLPENFKLSIGEN
jgi:cytoskeleton protein RodZ